MREDQTREETVDELRKRLGEMKRMMADRQVLGLGVDPYEDDDRSDSSRYPGLAVIDGSFLSWVFGVALLVIVAVSVYAFYNLYHAILKKFPSHHTEL